jgi:hypothetical protein
VRSVRCRISYALAQLGGVGEAKKAALAEACAKVRAEQQALAMGDAAAKKRASDHMQWPFPCCEGTQGRNVTAPICSSGARQELKAAADGDKEARRDPKWTAKIFEKSGKDMARLDVDSGG